MIKSIVLSINVTRSQAVHFVQMKKASMQLNCIEA